MLFLSTLTAPRIVVALPGANTFRCERHKDWDGGGCAQCLMLLVTRDEVVLRCLTCVFFVSWATLASPRPHRSSAVLFGS